MSKPRLRSLSGEEFCYLTTTGRKTNRPHEIEMWFASHPERDALYMLSGGRGRSDWVKNLREEPRVQIRLAGQTFEGRARIIEGGEEDELARDLLVEKYEREPGNLSQWREVSLPVRLDLT